MTLAWNHCFSNGFWQHCLCWRRLAEFCRKCFNLQNARFAVMIKINYRISIRSETKRFYLAQNYLHCGFFIFYWNSWILIGYEISFVRWLVIRWNRCQGRQYLDSWRPINRREPKIVRTTKRRSAYNHDEQEGCKCDQTAGDIESDIVNIRLPERPPSELSQALLAVVL